MNYDIVIIGCGVSGMTAAIYALRSDKSVLILEKESIGGAIASSPKIENYPGYQKISGAELADNLYEQVISLGGVIELEEVTEIKVGNEKEVITTDNIYTCKAIIIATGSKYKLLGLPNETDLIGNGVHFCVSCDGAFYKDKIVGVIGGGNTAITNALTLSEICKKVYIIQNLSDLTGEKLLKEKLKEKKNVEIYYESTVKELKKDDELKGITIDYKGKNKEIKLDGIFVSIGQVPETNFIKNIINLNEYNYVLSDSECKTNIKGVFVSGDVRDKKIRQLTTATNDGTISAIEAVNYIDSL